MASEILLQIASDVRDRFPEIRCGGFRTSSIPAIDEHAVGVDGELIRSELRAQGLTLDSITQDPRIAAWRSAIQGSGLKAAKVRGSAEQLVRRYLRGDSIGGPRLVRIYCSVSAKAVAPLGGYDVDLLPSCPIQLRFAQPGDRFEPLGGKASDMPLTPTIPVYAAGDTVLCWMFNVRDAMATALSDATTEALFVTEALTPAQAESSIEALTILRGLLSVAGAHVGPIKWNDAEGRLSIPTPS